MRKYYFGKCMVLSDVSKSWYVVIKPLCLRCHLLFQRNHLAGYIEDNQFYFLKSPSMLIFIIIINILVNTLTKCCHNLSNQIQDFLISHRNY